MIYDLLVVGAGPAGISAAVRAKQEGLTVLVLERGEVANTIFNFQKKKHVMAEPGMVPLRSDLQFEAGTRETILQRWHDAIRQLQVQINRPEAVQQITKADGLFTIQSDKASYQSRHVVLAIGIQGNPNRVGKPGEDLPHVSYTLSDPTLYQDQDILMIGAGDAAIEGVLALCEKNRVSVLNRNNEFFRLKDALDRRINEQVNAKQVVAYHSAAVERFEPGATVIILPDRVVRVKTDWVFIRIGASLPRAFLEKCGVTFASQERSALPTINEHYESHIHGLYVIGAVAGYHLIKQGMNQGYEVVEHLLGRPITPVDDPLLSEKLSFLPGTVDERLAQIAATIPILAPVQKQPLRELILQATVHRMPGGSVVFKENDFSDSLYMILEGDVAVSMVTQPQGSPPFHLACGGFFGEMSLLSGRRRSATVTTVGAATLLEAPRKAMLRLMANEPSVKRFLDETFIARAFRLNLFQEISEEMAQKLARTAQIKLFKKNDVICKEGEQGDSFFLIRSGSVKVSQDDGRTRRVLKYLPAGQYFGEMALLDPNDSRRVATVTAATACELIQVMKEDFDALRARFPALQQRLHEQMQRRHIHGDMIRSKDVLAPGADHEKAMDEVIEGTDVLLIDENKCVRCDHCVKACAETHGGQTRLYRKEGILFGHLNVPTSCRHCENPLCLTDCPPGDAIQRDPRGEVFINEAKCIGCGNCASNCPYGVIFMLHTKPKVSAWNGFLELVGLGTKAQQRDDSPTKAVKCDLCRDDPSGPACVRSCPTGAAFRVSPIEYFERVGTSQG